MQRKLSFCGLVLALASWAGAAHAAVFTFAVDPFAGSDALTTPGRQIVGGEPFITFNTATDVLSFAPTAFGVTPPVSFANDVAANLASSGLNVIVLRNEDTSFAAGTAANLIAAQVTGPGAGFFVYFNTGLDVVRLVYSMDLSDATADLAVLARFSNLDAPGALTNFTAANFVFDGETGTPTRVPEPPVSALLVLGLLLIVRRRGRALSPGYRAR